MHTPLFIESPDEVLAGIEEESLDIEVRFELLNLFDANGVDSGNVLETSLLNLHRRQPIGTGSDFCMKMRTQLVFSGHVHYENLALSPYEGFHHTIKQFILTSINYQDWITISFSFQKPISLNRLENAHFTVLDPCVIVN